MCINLIDEWMCTSIPLHPPAPLWLGIYPAQTHPHMKWRKIHWEPRIRLLANKRHDNIRISSSLSSWCAALRICSVILSFRQTPKHTWRYTYWGNVFIRKNGIRSKRMMAACVPWCDTHRMNDTNIIILLVYDKPFACQRLTDPDQAQP